MRSFKNQPLYLYKCLLPLTELKDDSQKLGSLRITWTKHADTILYEWVLKKKKAAKSKLGTL